MWKIREATDARVKLIEDLILQGELVEAKSKLESSSFSPRRPGDPPLVPEETHLYKLLALKQRETQPHRYDWRGDSEVQLSIEMARLTPSQAEEFYALLESGRLRLHEFPSYSIKKQSVFKDNLLAALAQAFRNGDLESEDLIEKYGL